MTDYPKTWDDIENNPTYRDIQRARRRLDRVMRGLERAAMICSAPGLGKSEETERAVKQAGWDYDYANPTTVQGLCRALWERRKKPFVTDDTDSLARSEQCLNIMKTALEKNIVIPPFTEKLHRNHQKRLLGMPHDPGLPPPQFKWNMPWLWNSNEPFHLESYRRATLKKTAGDFEALISRGLDPMWINSQPRNVALYTTWMIARGNLLRRMGLTLDQQQEVLVFFKEKATTIRMPSLRLAVRLAKTIKTDPDDYQSLWDDMIREARDTDGEGSEVDAKDFRGLPDMRALYGKHRADQPAAPPKPEPVPQPTPDPTLKLEPAPDPTPESVMKPAASPAADKERLSALLKNRKKPHADPEPEFVATEKTDDPWLSEPNWRALRTLSRDPACLKDIASRTIGELKKYGWIRIADYSDQGGPKTGIVTDDGEARLQLFYDAYGEDEWHPGRKK